MPSPTGTCGESITVPVRILEAPFRISVNGCPNFGEEIDPSWRNQFRRWTFHGC